MNLATLNEIDFFLNSDVFKILKSTTTGYEVSHRFLNKKIGHHGLSFVNSNGTTKYDKINFFNTIPDEEKKEIMKILNGEDKSMFINNKYVIKKTGSGSVIGNSNTTYSNVFIPFSPSY